MNAHAQGTAMHTSALDSALDPVAIVEVDIGRPRPTFPHRVIPAIVGGVFAGLLLIGLGCTPLFKAERSRPTAESGMIVHAKGQTKAVVDGGSVDNASPASSATTSAANSRSPSAASSAGTPTLASSSAGTGGAGSSGLSATHSFSVRCEPAHGQEDPRTPRPETVALQGIMAGKNARTALLNGTLYREGDHFGSSACPWTVAMIDPVSVRIEKAFGDRTCGVTIILQNRTASAANAQ